LNANGWPLDFNLSQIISDIVVDGQSGITVSRQFRRDFGRPV
jgi:hypothetical protein